MTVLNATPTVYVVDDDMWVRRALERVIRATGYRVRSFESAAEFLAAHDPAYAGCLILDVAMPGLGGLELQRRLNEAEDCLPIIFLTGCGSIALSVQAMKAGAVTFLTKPVASSELFSAVAEAIRVDHERRLERSARDGVRERLATLTRREREVLKHLLEGRLNKQIAGTLGTSQQTVKIHRARVMKKMHVKSVAELVWQVAFSELTCARRARPASCDLRNPSLEIAPYCHPIQLDLGVIVPFSEHIPP